MIVFGVDNPVVVVAVDNPVVDDNFVVVDLDNPVVVVVVVVVDSPVVAVDNLVVVVVVVAAAADAAAVAAAVAAVVVLRAQHLLAQVVAEGQGHWCLGQCWEPAKPQSLAQNHLLQQHQGTLQMHSLEK